MIGIYGDGENGGKDVISLLEMLGGINEVEYEGNDTSGLYYIDTNGEIAFARLDSHESLVLFSDGGLVYAYHIREFKENFPFVIGDKVSDDNGLVGEITGASWYDDRGVVLYTFSSNGLSITLWPCQLHLLEETVEFPMTYYECCKNLGLDRYAVMDCNDEFTQYTRNAYDKELLNGLDNLRRLIIIRDAYWLSAGGWKPDWTDNKVKYCVCVRGGKIEKCGSVSEQHLIAFPTHRMCEVFIDRFSGLLNNCLTFI